jgi:hypothetical protein
VPAGTGRRAERPNDGRSTSIASGAADRRRPNQPAVGHRISIDGAKVKWRTIIGVVEDVQERGYDLWMKPGFYIPTTQEVYPRLSDVNDPVTGISGAVLFRDFVRTSPSGRDRKNELREPPPYDGILLHHLSVSRVYLRHGRFPGVPQLCTMPPGDAPPPELPEGGLAIP